MMFWKDFDVRIESMLEVLFKSNVKQQQSKTRYILFILHCYSGFLVLSISYYILLW